MTDSITLSFWLRAALIVALDVCAIALIAFAAQRLTNSGSQHRAIWRAAQVALLLVLCFEFTGTGRGMANWLVGKSIPERKLSVRVSFPGQTIVPQRLEETAMPPAIQEPAGLIIPKSVWWPGLLWLGGAGLLLLKSAFGRSLFLVCGRRQTLADSTVRECVDVFAKRLGVRKKIRAIELKGIVSPVAHGIFRPTIGLPADFHNKFSREQQEAMLAHEIAHLAARDSFWYLLGDVCVALLWWHPLVWWMRRQLHSASEWAADESSVLIENGPTTLAECLVTLAGQMTPSRSFGWMGVEGNNFRSNLGKRVERLLKLHRHNWPQSQSRAIVLKFAATILLIVLVAFTSGWIQSKGTPREKTFDGALRQSWNQSLASVALGVLDMQKEQQEFLPRPHFRSRNVPVNSFIAGTDYFEKKFEGALNKATKSPITLAQVTKQDESKTTTRASEVVPPLIASQVNSATNSNPQLLTRIYKVDPNTFLRGLTNAGAIPAHAEPVVGAQKRRNSDIAEGMVGITRTNNTAAVVQAAVKNFFKSTGVDLAEPKAVFFNATGGALFVRATAQDLDIIESAIQVLNYEPPQVNINARFVEIDETKAKKHGLDWLLGNIGVPLATNSVSSQLSSNGIESLLPVSRETGVQLKNSVGVTMTGILTELQYRKVLQLLEKTDGVDILSTPQVTTVSGRQAQIQIAEMRTLVTGLTSTKDTNGATSHAHQTQSVPFGPTLDVIPTVSADGHTIQMTLIPTVTEFLGYDDPGQFATYDYVTPPASLPSPPSLPSSLPQPRSGNRAGVAVPLRAQMPLPHFRVRQITTSANVWDGQTIVLGGLVKEDTVRVKYKVPVLGSIPGVGRLFRSESNTEHKKNLLIFVTPTIIDPTGNRVHPK